MLRFVVRAGKAAGIPVSLCGEMPRSPISSDAPRHGASRAIVYAAHGSARARWRFRATEIAARRGTSRRSRHERHKGRQPWGFEAAVRPDRPLRGKALFIKAGSQLSLQYHEKKDGAF